MKTNFEVVGVILWAFAFIILIPIAVILMVVERTFEMLLLGTGKLAELGTSITSTGVNWLERLN